jgi:hypothetical protein
LPALTKASRIPLGESGEKLHDWAFATRTFRAVHGVGGGATGPDDDIAAEYFQNIGATIMGRHCLAATARGEIILGMVGGEKIRLSICRSSS